MVPLFSGLGSRNHRLNSQSSQPRLSSSLGYMIFFSPSTPVVLVTQPSPLENGSATIEQVLPNWIRVTPFLRGRGVMHMKFLLLFYKSGRLRIVISTANLIEHDWRDIENTVWVQDVPRRPSPIAHEPKADDFASGS